MTHIIPLAFPPAAILAPPFRFLFADLHLVSFLFFTGDHWDTLLIPDWDAEGDCKDFVTSYYPSQRRRNGISRPLAQHTHAHMTKLTKQQAHVRLIMLCCVLCVSCNQQTCCENCIYTVKHNLKKHTSFFLDYLFSFTCFVMDCVGLGYELYALSYANTAGLINWYLSPQRTSSSFIPRHNCLRMNMIITKM